jgi:very-short-patch-repair endonuclease
VPDRFQQLNRKSFIHELKDVPQEIRNWHKANKKLTKIERMVSAFLQDCIALKWVAGCTTQQIIKLGATDKYIMVDFFLKSPEVIIEIDGPEHKEKRDATRDAKLLELFDYRVLRVTNDQVKMQNRDTRTDLLRRLSRASGLTPEQADDRIERYWKLKDRGLV